MIICIHKMLLHCLVASEIPGRTGQQCMHRWQKALMPGIKKGRWTAEEDEVKVALAVNSECYSLTDTAT